jgi:hypothetical protein
MQGCNPASGALSGPPVSPGLNIPLPGEIAYNKSVENRTEPRTLWQWIRYIVVAIIAIWLVIWMLKFVGINLF